MSETGKVGLSVQQIALLLEIIDKASFAGSAIEVIIKLKQTLIVILKDQQKTPPVAEKPQGQ